MGRGVMNIVIGGLLVAGGLSGKYALMGTQSSGALVVLGVLAILWGAFQIFQQKKG